jgi:ABC-type branched-subunit amino acid transport system substrate-binding protein
MKIRTRSGAAALIATALLAAATGCSTKSSNSSSGSGGGSGTQSGGVKTGRGVSGNTITLGVLTDFTGAFAALGKDVTNANQLFWDQQNAKGGVCGKYQVKLNVKDHGYVVQNGVQLYNSMKGNVLAIQHTIGSPINTALADQLKADHMVNVPEAWARNLTQNPQNAVVGATYDVEMINGLNYLLTKGLIKQGDKIGHIYFEGEYGANGLAGSKYFASKHGMTVVEQKIKATDLDMSAPVTQLKAAGVKAIALTEGPNQTASVASVAGAQGLNVPLIGNNPTTAPGLMTGPSADYLAAHFYAAAPFSDFSGAGTLLQDFTKKYPAKVPQPSLGVIHGFADADVMRQILDRACSDGDLTPEGVTKAKSELTSVDTGGLVVRLDFSKPGTSPSNKSYILQAAKGVAGGAKALTEAVESPDVAGFQPPTS